MSIDTNPKKPAGPIISDIERGLAQWGILWAELGVLMRQRAELKTVVEHAVASEELPRLQAAVAEAKAQAETLLATAREEADRILSEAEEKARGVLAEAEAKKAKATQEADCIIGDAKRKALSEAVEVAAQERRELADAKTKLVDAKNGFAQQTRGFREAVARIALALDSIDRFDTARKAGEA